MQDNNLDAFLVESDARLYAQKRDAVLLTGDVEQVQQFFERYNGIRMPERIVEAAMHKAITGSTGLPRDYRLKSKVWLAEQGMTSLDDGDLSDG